MIIDIVVLVVLFISALIAFIRGFIREVLTIAGVVGGLAAAYAGGPVLKPLFNGWLGVEAEPEEPQKFFDLIPYDWVGTGLAYASIFLIVVILISIISHFLAESVRNMGLGAADRTFGVVFGLARGVLLLGLFYLPCHLFMGEEIKEKYVGSAKTGFYLAHTSDFLSGFLPEGTKDNVEEQADQIKEVVSAKDQLENLKLLKKSDEDAPEKENTSTLQEGYSENVRETMNDLFEKQQDEAAFPGYNE